VIAEIVSIGTELLLGEIVDTNAAHIARHLTAIGVDHLFSSTVGDNEDRIVHVLRMAMDRSDVLITTGGLGPTVDDITRQAVARATDIELVSSPELLTQIEAHFRSRGYSMTENNRRQALIPLGAIPVENPVGTAPAFIVETGAKAIVCLPGVPREMAYLLQERVLPYLRQRMGQDAVILSRWVHTAAIGESAVDQAISDLMRWTNPTVGTRAHPGQTDVCITAKAGTREKAMGMLDAMEAEVRTRLGVAVYGVDDETLAGVVASALEHRGLSLAVADTVTEGAIAERLRAHGPPCILAAARSADTLNHLGQELSLGPQTDAETVSGVASALRAALSADLGLAVVSVGRPEPRVVAALATPGGSRERGWPSRGSSEHAIEWNVHLALDLLRRWLILAEEIGPA